MIHSLHAVSLAALLVGTMGSACAGREPNGDTAGSSIVTKSGQPGSSANVVGAWHVTELAIRTPGSDWEVRPRPQGGLYVFSERHYSYVYIPGGRVRGRFAVPNSPSEAEKAAAYDTFIAGAGSYRFDGSTLELRADLRKNPNEMTGDTWKWKVKIGGRDTLQFVFENPPFLPGRQWRTTLVRAE